jgi:hypothetical protein
VPDVFSHMYVSLSRVRSVCVLLTKMEDSFVVFALDFRLPGRRGSLQGLKVNEYPERLPNELGCSTSKSINRKLVIENNLIPSVESQPGSLTDS